jgi:N-methylhydantoinase B/oxoprolinase/acetone carboxylase alpha subunit
VVQAAVIYVLRALVAERIPLNAGCLAPVTIAVPPGSLLDPPRGSAVVGGNVETSQRVVDVLLGALGLAAASQGTMNNLTSATRASAGDDHAARAREACCAWACAHDQHRSPTEISRAASRCA